MATFDYLFNTVYYGSTNQYANYANNFAYNGYTAPAPAVGTTFVFSTQWVTTASTAYHRSTIDNTLWSVSMTNVDNSVFTNTKKQRFFVGGSYNSSSLFKTSNIDWHEIRVYSTNLVTQRTDADVQAIVTELKTKWSVV